MGFNIKEAVAYFMEKWHIESDMAVSVDGLPDVVAIGRRDGRIVPILKPGSSLTEAEIMEKAGIKNDRPRRGRGVHIVSDMPIAFVDSKHRKNRTNRWQ